MTLTFELLTLKVVTESRVTWTTSVPILVFPGLSVLDLGQIYVTDVRQHHCLMPRLLGAGHNKCHQSFHAVSLTLVGKNSAQEISNISLVEPA